MKTIITISREFASGGRTIGKEVAKALGFSFYDSQIIDMAAKDSGLSPDFIKNTEQNLQSGWGYNLLLSSFCVTGMTGSNIINSGTVGLPLADQVFNAQRKVILDIAQKAPCVIVGRCADFILSKCTQIEKSSLLNVFIYADLQDKIDRVKNEYGTQAKDIKQLVISVNKRRANHYNTFTDSTWGRKENYDLMINTSCFGIKGATDLIVQASKSA